MTTLESEELPAMIKSAYRPHGRPVRRTAYALPSACPANFIQSRDRSIAEMGPAKNERSLYDKM